MYTVPYSILYIVCSEDNRIRSFTELYLGTVSTNANRYFDRPVLRGKHLNSGEALGAAYAGISALIQKL